MELQANYQIQGTKTTGMQKKLQETQLPSQRLTLAPNTKLGLTDLENLQILAFHDCLAIRNTLTPEIAFKSSDMQISGIKKNNEFCLIGVVSLLLTELAKTLNTTEKLDIGQNARITNALLKDFWYFKLEEFVYIFDMVTKRKNYNRLDQTVIYDAFNEYELKRQSVIENIKIQEFQVSEEQKQKEIDELRELYAKARNEGKQELYIDKQAKMAEELKQKALEANKREIAFLLFREQEIQKRKAEKESHELIESQKVVPDNVIKKVA